MVFGGVAAMVDTARKTGHPGGDISGVIEAGKGIHPHESLPQVMFAWLEFCILQNPSELPEPHCPSSTTPVGS